jgi:uncharacterized protein
MIHLTAADYTRQAWKNGRGVTTELLHIRESDGRTRLRLSRASVTEDGPFSVFPGINRNLTVLSGPGFRLSGSGLDFRCNPLVPVGFPGSIDLTATETNEGPSDDFNVMVADNLPMPQVMVVQDLVLPIGDHMIYALGQVTANGTKADAGDLLLATKSQIALTGLAVVVGLSWPQWTQDQDFATKIFGPAKS